MMQKNYIAGLYLRLSKDDERQGESLSIENQRVILRKYAEEHGLQIYDEYIDDGVSGTTFDRPQVQRLLNDAKTGVINTILVKNLSRFGRNYIEVGQYLDYVFPTFGIRFIAIQDNIDTENRKSTIYTKNAVMTKKPLQPYFSSQILHEHNLCLAFRLLVLRIISPLSRTGKYRGKQKSRLLYSEYSVLETTFLFYFYAIFSARKGTDCKGMFYFPLSLTVAI